jgi:hypothetical protein
MRFSYPRFIVAVLSENVLGCIQSTPKLVDCLQPAKKRERGKKSGAGPGERRGEEFEKDRRRRARRLIPMAALARIQRHHCHGGDERHRLALYGVGKVSNRIVLGDENGRDKHGAKNKGDRYTLSPITLCYK